VLRNCNGWITIISNRIASQDYMGLAKFMTACCVQDTRFLRDPLEDRRERDALETTANRKPLEPLTDRIIDLEKPIMHRLPIEDINKGLQVCEKRVGIRGMATFRIG